MLSARLRITLLCGLICLALASCDESQLTPPEPTLPGDTTGPSVVSVAPAVGATGVQGATTVRAAFSERLQASTVTTSTFTVSNGAAVDGSVTVTDSIGVFTPGTPLEPNTAYTARITTGIQDLAGNALASDYVWTFTTGAPADTVRPTVVDISPANNATGVVVSTTVRATFSELMDGSTFDAGTFVVSGPSGAVSGIVALDGAVASFTPSSPLQFETAYNARVTTDAHDLAGNSLASDFVFHFTTAPAPDETRPEVQSVQPLSTEIDVDVDTSVKATFTEAMSPGTITTSTFRLAAGATPVTGTVSLTDFTATFRPSSPLSPGTTYTATVTTAVEDLAGNNLGSNYVWQFTTAVPPDVTPPTVTSTNPANGATSVASGVSVTATFSEPMDSASVTGTTFRLSHGATPVGGLVSLAGTIATFTPSNALLPSTLYTARITTGVQDRAGNNLASEYSWTFTTAAAPDLTPPTVQSVLPVSNATNVAHGTTVQATFSEPVKASTVTSSTFTLTGPGGPVLATRLASGSTATLTPSAPLAANTLYTARVTTGVTDLADNPLGSEFVWTFTTAPPPDVTPPTVTGRVPSPGATGVGTSAVVQATFSETMSAASITTAFMLNGGAGAVSGSVSLSGQTATFTPTGPLAYGTTYTATVTTGAEDLAGNNLAQIVVWTFTTADPPDATPPTVTGVTPFSAATSVDLNTNVTATFSEAVLPASVSASTFSLAGGSGGVAGVVTLSGQTATLNPNAPLQYSTTYTAIVKTGVEDLAGNHLAADFSWTFTTEPAPDLTPPTVSLVAPASGATNVSTGINVEATFSEAVAPASVTTGSFQLTGPSGAVGGSVSLSGQKAVFNPSSNLDAGATYTARVTTIVEDLAGNNLAADFVWSFTTAPPPDTTPPTVAGTTPTVGATNVDVSANITATFSEAVLPASVNASTFAVAGGQGDVAGTVTLSGLTATLNPSTPLAFGTTYTAVVTTGVEDLASNHLSSDFIWTFTTATAPDSTAPTVIGTTPADGAPSVDRDATIRATFSEDVQPSSVNATTVTLGDGSGAIAASVTLSGTVASLRPDAPLEYATSYTATVTTGVQDLAGNHLASNFTWTFTTQPAPDTTGPTVGSVVPTSGALGVDTAANLTATFSEPVSAATVSAGTFTLAGAGGGAVAGAVALSGQTATFDPTSSLAAGATYTARITTGVEDLAGNPLPSEFVWSFTTQAPPDTTSPTVGSVTPAAGATLVAVGTNVGATFSESIDPATVTASTFTLSSSSGPVAGARTVSGATATLNPTANLATNTVYTATLTTGVRGIDGNPLATPFVWTFTTTHLAPTADAGPDQEVFVGSTVTLDGTGSSDPEGQPLTYVWHQMRGSPVNGGNDLTGPTPTFTAPLLPEDRIEFQLRVSDGDFTSGPDRVRIDVVALPLSIRSSSR